MSRQERQGVVKSGRGVRFDKRMGERAVREGCLGCHDSDSSVGYGYVLVFGLDCGGGRICGFRRVCCEE